MFDHEKLIVYQHAIEYVAWADAAVLERLPSKVSARDQLERATTSIVLNIAEGNGKSAARDRARFFEVARGSALECAACLDVLVAKRLLTAEEVGCGKQKLGEITAMLMGLLKKFSDRISEDAGMYGHSGEQEQEQERE